MKINVLWSDSGKTFSVSLDAGKGDFLSIKGCRLADGNDGQFVSWPATKLDDGKWFRYAWANEAFSSAVLQKALEGKKSSATNKKSYDEVPF